VPRQFPVADAVTPKPKPIEPLVYTECQDCGAELEHDDYPFDAFFLFGLCVYGRKRRGKYGPDY